MTTRLRLHRVFLCVLCVGAVFMVLSLQHNWSAEKPTQAVRKRFVEVADEQNNEKATATAKEAAAVPLKLKQSKAVEEEMGDVLDRPWYMKHGNAYPEVQQSESKLFPDQVDAASDRIIEQLMYMPSDYEGKHKYGGKDAVTT